jgi:hypothetical protein
MANEYDKCPHCTKTFDDPKAWNAYNIEKHINKCAQKSRGCIQLTNFISMARKRPISELTVCSIDENSCDSRSIDENSCDSQSNDTVENGHKKSKGLCAGYAAKVNRVYMDFPFQLFELEKHNINYTFENGVFHHKSCCQDGYQLRIESSQTANECCQALEYNVHLQKIIQRAHEIKKHSNYKYFTHSQIKELLNEKNELINQLKMKNLNITRQNLILNKINTDYKRFFDLVASNNIENLNRVN